MRFGGCAGFALALLTRSAVRRAALCFRRPRTDRLPAFRDLHVQPRHDDARRHHGPERNRLQLRRGAGPAVDRNLARAASTCLPAAAASVGLSNVELAAKYRFLHQDLFGLDVSVFPRIFLPSGSNSIGDNHASLLLPVWVQKDWSGGWSAFGGGGCTVSEFRAVDFCQAGARPDLSASAQASDRRRTVSPDRGFERHARDLQRRHRMALRSERQLPSARLCQARNREHRRDRSIFLVRLRAVHILS